MKRLYRLLMALAFFLPVAMHAQLQNGNEIVVQVSKEKTIVNGKSFYMHTVKKGENIFRISRAYNVTQKDIIIANPEAISGSIKEGQVLKIPVEPASPRNIQQIESENFIYHITEEKQTVFFLTQKYKVTQDELIRYNPELEFSPLQAGQVVKIPKSPNVPLGPDKFRPIERYEEYKVGRKETKYSIARDHNITVNELIEANPILNKEDLQKGQVLQIPVKSSTEIVTVPVVDVPDTSTLIAAMRQTTPCEGYKAFSEPLNVALLLPVFIEGNETVAMIDSANAANDGDRRNIESNDLYQLTANIMEFYQGALLAIDSLKKAGLSVKLFTYDTGRDNQKLPNILLRPEMAKMDLIIGPLTYISESLEKTAQFALKNRIKMVSPVSTNTRILMDNPYVFQVNTNASHCIDALLKYINVQDNTNVVLVNSNRASDKDTFELFRDKLSAYIPNRYKIFNYSDNAKPLEALLVKNAENIIILPSEHEIVINKIMNYLNFRPQRASTKVFGLSAWPVLTGLDQEFLHNLEFQYASSFYLDFKDKKAKGFLDQYKAYYKSEPYFHTRDNSPQFFSKDGYNFAFAGYDIAFYFLNSMGRMGKDFENCLGQQKIDLLHTNIIFEKISPTGGFVNKGVNVVKYDKDFNVFRINP